VIFHRERDRVLNALDMPLSTYLDLGKAARDDIINGDEMAASAAWSLAICQTTFNRILHFKEVCGGRTGPSASCVHPHSPPYLMQGAL